MSFHVNLGEPTFGEEEIIAVSRSSRIRVTGRGARSEEPRVRGGVPPAAAHRGRHREQLHRRAPPRADGVRRRAGRRGDRRRLHVPGHRTLGCSSPGRHPSSPTSIPKRGAFDPAAVEALIGPQHRGVIAVDALGQCADYQELRKLTSANGLFLVEDAACCRRRHVPRATVRGIPGSRTSPSSASTDARASRVARAVSVTSGDAALIERVREAGCVRNRKRPVRQGVGRPARSPVFDTIGYNYKLSDIAAAIALVQLGRLPDLVAARRTAATVVRGRVRGTRCSSVRPWSVSTTSTRTQSYVLTLDPSINRDTVARCRCVLEGVGANIGTYAWHLQPVYGPQASCRSRRTSSRATSPSQCTQISPSPTSST